MMHESKRKAKSTRTPIVGDHGIVREDVGRLLAVGADFDVSRGLDSNVLELSDVIDCEKTQSLMEKYHAVTRIPIGIVDIQGKVLVKTGWQTICTRFHRANPRSCQACVDSNIEHTRNVPDGTFRLYQCHHHMWETVTPIMIAGRHMGNIFLGQFMFDDDPPDYEVFRQQARRYGYNEKQYLAALDQVPRLSRKQVDAAMAFYIAFGGMISNLSFSNLQLARALEERTRTQENIALLNFALNKVSEAAFLITEDGRFTYANDSACRTLGYGLGELLTMRVSDIDPGQTARHWDRHWQELRRSGRLTFDSEHCSKDGRIIPVEISANFFEYNGKAYNLALARDITERRALEVQLRQTQKLEAIGQLAGGVAHDFNNSLIAITMLADLIRKAAGRNQSVQETLRDLDDELNRAASLTRQLLLFGRRSVRETRLLNLNDTVENLLRMLGRLLGEQVNLRFHPADGLRNIQGDAGMFDQVITNLAVNARDAMPQGGIISIATQNVEIHPAEAVLNPNRQPGSFVKLAITDTGVGMDETVLKHIYEPFFTTKAPGKGTGLGLATVHAIVKQHHGWVEVDSQPGKGSRFSIFLPACTAVLPADSPSGQEKGNLRGTETILLVEDELKVRRSISRNLQLMGYTVLEAINGPTALEKWRQNPSRVDLLLTDMVLPEGMNGADLARELKAQRPDLKTIIISGYVEDGDLRRKLEEGDGVFLHKPFNALTLGKKVRECLNQETT
jgi:PAS domain S-box-containing protein